MRACALLLLLLLLCCAVDVARGWGLGGGGSRRAVKADQTAGRLYARKRKVTRARSDSPQIPAATVIDVDEFQAEPAAETEETGAAELSSLTSRASKLSPLTGTLASRVAELESKSWVERTVGEYTAPTPVGQEPKLFKAMKTVTWGAVLLLVLTEIFVSIKVGGAPFKFGEMQLPSLPSMSFFSGGAGPPPTP